MRNFSAFLIAILLVGAGRSAFAADRDNFRFYVGGGDAHVWATATEPGTSAQLSGEFYSLEAGIDAPFTANVGLNLGVEAGQENLVNAYSSTTYLELSQMTSEALKLGLFFGHFGIGGGYRIVSLTLNSVSSTSGGDSVNLSGGGPLGYANLSFDIGNRARGAIEGQYNTLSAGNITMSGFSVGLKFYLLFGGDR